MCYGHAIGLQTVGGLSRRRPFPTKTKHACHARLYTIRRPMWLVYPRSILIRIVPPFVLDATIPSFSSFESKLLSIKYRSMNIYRYLKISFTVAKLDFRECQCNHASNFDPWHHGSDQWMCNMQHAACSAQHVVHRPDFLCRSWLPSPSRSRPSRAPMPSGSRHRRTPPFLLFELQKNAEDIRWSSGDRDVGTRRAVEDDDGTLPCRRDFLILVRLGFVRARGLKDL